MREKLEARKIKANWEHNTRMIQMMAILIMNNNIQQQNPQIVQPMPPPSPVDRNKPSPSQTGTEGMIAAIHGTQLNAEEQVKRRKNCQVQI